ncbi:universal stress protein UspE [Aliiglaciecola litoralis]|uniref:Universal stress protein UspE n=1 Tax=Aliiglaciecola litoralis TaxID=582857 RepID=A0ABP3X185_9ALTE
MKAPKNILVVISGKRKTHEALERALLFVTNKAVHLHIFNAIYEPVMELSDVLSSAHREEMKQQYLADRHLYMDEIAAQLENKGIKCSVHVAWHRELHEAIEQAAIELKPDLVIKRISADTDSINPFAMPVDRHLLRYCSVPLLLIKGSQWSKGPILATIDPHASDEAHITLNNKVLNYAKLLGKMTDNPVYGVASYIVPSMSPAIGLPGVDYDLIRQDTFKFYEEKMQTLLTAHNIPLSDMHIIEGQPQRAIPKFVEQNDAHLVVLGTVGRTGISAAFIGNTAEHVLANLECEVLALKPAKEI